MDGNFSHLSLMPRVAKSKPADSTANLGLVVELWLAVDKSRNNMRCCGNNRFWPSL